MLSNALARLGLLLLVLSLATGCARTTATVVPTDVSCRVFTPIQWSAKDTDKTITEVKIHNAVWRAVCGALDAPTTPG